MQAAQRGNMTTADNYPIFVSYYTPNTQYEVRAAELKQSLENLGLSNLVGALPSLGSWSQNCAQKSTFVCSEWENSDRALCWVDADALVLRKPLLLENFDADFAVVARQGWNFSGGQIAFGKTERGGQLLKRWQHYCQTHPHIWDQISLAYAWWDQTLEEGFNTLWLPESIMGKGSAFKPLRTLQTTYSRAVFCHFQESRRSRKTFDHRKKSQLRQGEFQSKNLPKWWRDAVAARKPFPLTDAQKRELGLRPHET
jgi:hypothetical protein